MLPPILFHSLRSTIFSGMLMLNFGVVTEKPLFLQKKFRNIIFVFLDNFLNNSLIYNVLRNNINKNARNTPGISAKK